MALPAADDDHAHRSTGVRDPGRTAGTVGDNSRREAAESWAEASAYQWKRGIMMRHAGSMESGRQSTFTALWHCLPLASSEYASLRQEGEGFQLRGIVVLPLGHAPCRIEYRVVVDHNWWPLSAVATVTTPERAQEISLACDGAGRWTLNGEPAPSLHGCHDLDLGWTPATNTIPIRRLDLQVGEHATIAAAWIQFPELDVVRSGQQYERLASNRWRYRSGTYDFELVTDAASGLVLAYGDDLWRAVVTTVN